MIALNASAEWARIILSCCCYWHFSFCLHKLNNLWTSEEARCSVVFLSGISNIWRIFGRWSPDDVIVISRSAANAGNSTQKWIFFGGSFDYWVLKCLELMICVTNCVVLPMSYGHFTVLIGFRGLIESVIWRSDHGRSSKIVWGSRVSSMWTIYVPDISCTGRMGWMAQRKWKEAKQLPGTAAPGLSCCLISFHFLWAIHPLRPVVYSLWSCEVVKLPVAPCLGANWNLCRSQMDG